MKLCKTLVACGLIWASSFSTSDAAVRYWDTNGDNAGATDDGGGSASGNWATDLFWTTLSTGIDTVGDPGSAGAVWVASDTAVFSAAANATGTSVITLLSPLLLP